eukprot:1454860-Lingulodinium_polyedra.AAC.1
MLLVLLLVVLVVYWCRLLTGWRGLAMLVGAGGCWLMMRACWCCSILVHDACWMMRLDDG